MHKARVSIHVACLALGVLSFSKAYAAIGVEVLTGYAPVGTLAVDESMSTRAIPVIGMLSYQGDQSESFVWGVGVTSHFSQVFYKRENLKYNGIFNAVGLNLSLGARFGVDKILVFQGEGLFRGQLSVKTKTSAVINGQEFQHSTVITYLNSRPSNAGVLARVGFISDMKGGQFTKSQYMRLGLTVDYLQQPFDLQNTDVRTSNASVFPGQTTQETVNYNLSLISINFLVGFVF